MKFSLGVAAALAGCAAASQPADVYILSQNPSSTEQVDRSTAHLVFLQRLSTDGAVGSLGALADDDLDVAISSINKFGKQAQTLFSKAAADPSQLLILLEGITADNHDALNKALGKTKPSFQVIDTPSSIAHRSLAQRDLASAGVAQTKCTLERAINPLAEECWNGKSSVAVYDIKRDPSAAQSLADNIPRLNKLALAGEMETTLVLIPDSTRSSGIDAWSSSPLRRRETEEVMTEVDETAPIAEATSAAQPVSPFATRINDRAIPACFSSQSACQNATNNCSGHGSCDNKYPGFKDCFYCNCSRYSPEDPHYWVGATCSKQDVSVPFWLFAGVGLLLLGILSFAVTLLFNVGEEKLPGVIGAGVSKSSK